MHPTSALSIDMPTDAHTNANLHGRLRWQYCVASKNHQALVRNSEVFRHAIAAGFVELVAMQRTRLDLQLISATISGRRTKLELRRRASLLSQAEASNAVDADLVARTPSCSKAPMSELFKPSARPAGSDRSVRPARDLPARLGDRSLRLPLLLLHVGAYDLLAQEGPPLAGGARSGVLGLRRQGRAQAANHRRRAADAQEHPVAVPRALAPSRQRRARRADADHQRQPAAEVRAGAQGCRRPPHQHLARHARARPLQGDHALGRSSPR